MRTEHDEIDFAFVNDAREHGPDFSVLKNHLVLQSFELMLDALAEILAGFLFEFGNLRPRGWRHEGVHPGLADNVNSMNGSAITTGDFERVGQGAFGGGREIRRKEYVRETHASGRI